MAYNNQNNNTDWISKEKRELFGKAVNSILMTGPSKILALNDVLDSAKQIVDFAFQSYPDNEDKNETEKPL